MDLTKVASVMAATGADILSMVGWDRVPCRGLPAVMLPTTSGSGPEVSPVATFTFAEEKVRKGVVSSFLVPYAAIVDPELTWSVPPKVTADTGMDALIHAAESFLSVNANPFSESLSLETVRRIASSLKDDVMDGRDAASRRGDVAGKPYGRNGLRHGRYCGCPCPGLSPGGRVQYPPGRGKYGYAEERNGVRQGPMRKENVPSGPGCLDGASEHVR